MDKQCTMGVGCDEAGVCFAAAHGRMDQCGRPAPQPPSASDDDDECTHEFVMFQSACVRCGQPYDETPGVDAAEQKPVPLNVIREWPDGLAEMVDATLLDTVGYTLNYRLYDLQQAMAKFGFTMTVTEAASSPAASADEWLAEAERLVAANEQAYCDASLRGTEPYWSIARASRLALLAHLKARP